MATSEATYTSLVSNNSEMQAWGTALAAQFDAVGFVRTADTGQITWASATTSGGYEIRQLPDVVGGMDVRVKLTYSTNSNKPAIAWRIGTSTNGSGTITGQFYNETVGPVYPSASGSYVNYVSMTTDENGFYFALNTTASGPTPALAIFLFIERSMDATGAATGDGIFWMGGCSNYQVYGGVIPGSETPQASFTSPWPVAMAEGYSIVPDGGNYKVGMWPNLWMAEAEPRLTRMLAHVGADITIDTVVSCNHQGSARPYRILGQRLPAQGSHSANSAFVAMPWE